MEIAICLLLFGPVRALKATRAGGLVSSHRGNRTRATPFYGLWVWKKPPRDAMA